jgi:hypothetical protein
MNYSKNECRWIQIDYSYSENEKTGITIHPAVGSFKNEVDNRTYTLVVKHLKRIPKIIRINGKILNQSKWSITDESTLTIKTDSYHVKTKLAINFN